MRFSCLCYVLVACYASVLPGCRCRSSPDRASAPAPAPGVVNTGVIATEVATPPPDDAGLGPDARRYRELRDQVNKHAMAVIRRQPETDPEKFGYKIGWLAVATEDGADVAQRLGLRAKPATWRAGIDAAYDGLGTFVTPPVQGLTIVVSSAVLEADIERLEALVVELSKHYGEVQAFMTHRVFEYHGWVIAQVGNLRRSYAYDGEKKGLVRNFGAPVPEEEDVPTPLPDGAVLMTPAGIVRAGGPIPPEARHEGDVMSVAEKLSVLVTDLGPHNATAGRGLLGQIFDLEAPR